MKSLGCIMINGKRAQLLFVSHETKWVWAWQAAAKYARARGWRWPG